MIRGSHAQIFSSQALNPLDSVLSQVLLLKVQFGIFVKQRLSFVFTRRVDIASIFIQHLCCTVDICDQRPCLKCKLKWHQLIIHTEVQSEDFGALRYSGSRSVAIQNGEFSEEYKTCTILFMCNVWCLLRYTIALWASLNAWDIRQCKQPRAWRHLSKTRGLKGKGWRSGSGIMNGKELCETKLVIGVASQRICAADCWFLEFSPSYTLT